MKQYSAEEIQELLTVKGGTPEEQAAALVVVEAAVLESRRLGRIATSKPKSSWTNSAGNLRSPISGRWGSLTGR